MEFLLNTNIQFYILAYMIGGIPFGLILAKIYGSVNILEEGSGSIGATNVLRVLKEKDPALAKKLSIMTLSLDAIKGIFVLLIAQALGLSESVLWAIAVLAVVGHCFSPFLKLEGGKGVATGMGVSFYMIPIETLIGVAVWFLLAKTLRVSSLSSIGGLIAVIVAFYLLQPTVAHAPMILIAFFIFYKHIPNFIRLIKGEEKRVV